MKNLLFFTAQMRSKLVSNYRHFYVYLLFIHHLSFNPSLVKYHGDKEGVCCHPVTRNNMFTPPAASVLLSAIIWPGSDTLTENLSRGYQMNKFS